MAERFLEPNVPLKKINNETGDIDYIYPQTTASQVIMSEDGERLNTILTENILYLDDADEGGIETINADTLGGKTYSDIVNLIYPVGSVYMSVNETSPATLFGGTWERIKDTFLLSAGDTYTAGAVGGEATHTLTKAEMPAHTHTRGTMEITGSFPASLEGSGTFTTTGAFATTSEKNYFGWGITGPDYDNYGIQFTASRNWTGATSSVGSGSAHNNMPPYLAVYVWKRTA